VNFLAPLAFWFALTLPAVVVFYLLKRKRVVRMVPSTLLWQRFLAENQAAAPFQKLRHNWLLLLQLLFLALLVLALARPYFQGRMMPRGLRVLVLDASASMQATDVAPSRFERARAEALKLVDSLEGGSDMVVLLAGASAEVRQGATQSKGSVRRVIEAARPTDCPTRLVEALRVAETLTRDKPMAEVHLFSDGALGNLDEFGLRDLPLVYHRVGERVRNAAITGLEVRAHPEDPSRRAVFASLQNFGPEPVNAIVELRFEDQLVEARPVSLPATNSAAVIFTAAQPRDGVFKVTLRHDDDLAVDNEARVISRLPGPVKVLLVTRGNRFLERALKAASPLAEISIATDYDTNAQPDIVVLDDVLPTTWPDANLLALHVANTNWFPEGLQVTDTPPIVDWRNTHPLLRFVSFDNVQIAQSYAGPTPPWAIPLVDSPQAPLIIAGEIGRQRIVWVGFDALQSTWPLRISFPIFIANSVDWLNPASAGSERFQVQAGDAFRLPLSGQVTEARITAPDGRTVTLPLGPQTRELVYGDTARRGVYEVSLGTNQVRFAVNLLDPAESNLTPRGELAVGRRGEVKATTEKRANLEHWRWFALAGLAVMLGEWWWFHRRTA
jgi:Ca-activated chloride channel homolog